MIQKRNGDKTETADKTCRLFSLCQNYGADKLTMAKWGASLLFQAWWNPVEVLNDDRGRQAIWEISGEIVWKEVHYE